MSYSNGFTFFQGKFIKSTAEGDKCKKRRHSSLGNDVTKRVYFQIKTPSRIPISRMIMCTHNNVWIDSRVACKGKLISSAHFCVFLTFSFICLTFSIFYNHLCKLHAYNFLLGDSPRIFSNKEFSFSLCHWIYSWSVIDTIHTLLQKSNISFLTRPINHYIYASWISHEKRFDCSLWLKLSCVGVFWTNVNKKKWIR